MSFHQDEFHQVADYDEIIEGLENIEELDSYFRDKVAEKIISQSDYNYIHKNLYGIVVKLKGQLDIGVRSG